jgi:hypothetical protein
LARCEDDEPRPLFEFAQLRGEVGPGDDRHLAAFILEVKQRLPVDQRAVADEIEDVVTLAQFAHDVAQRRAARCRERGHGNVLEPRGRALCFAGHVHRRKRATAGRVGTDVRGIRDRDQRPHFIPRAEMHRPPIFAADEPREEQLLARGEKRARLRIAERLPGETVQFGRVVVDGKSHAQRHAERFRHDAALLEPRSDPRIREQTLPKELPVNLPITARCPQRFEVDRRLSGDRRHVRLAVRAIEPQLDADVVTHPLQTNFEFDKVCHRIAKLSAVGLHRRT